MTRILEIEYSTPATPAEASRVVKYDTPLIGDLCQRVQLVDPQGLVLYSLPVAMFDELRMHQTEVDLGIGPIGNVKRSQG